MTINVPIKVKQYKDKSGAWIIYNNKFDICAYGQTKKEAREMFLSVVGNILWDSMSEMQKKRANPKYKTTEK